MDAVVSPYTIMMGLILIATPAICWGFTRHAPEVRTPLKNIGKMIHEQRYYLHILGYVLIIRWKDLTDVLNDPIKPMTGHWTDWVWAIEGSPTLWIQSTFEHVVLTEFLTFHYMFLYLFLIYVTTVFYAYVGERDLTDKVTMNYLLIYALAVPYYLFFNVEVTSSWIPGMKALLYHDGWYTAFFVRHDPLDNAVPSLHIAIPFGILLLNWLHVRERGERLRDWIHWRYHLFILGNTLVFAFAILYLGIHWVTDIPVGMAVGSMGALFIHYVQPRLRNNHGGFFKGFTLPKVSRHVIIEGTFAILIIALLLNGVQHQVETLDDRASMRLGPGDSRFDIVQPLPEEGAADFRVTNLHGNQSLEAIVLVMENEMPAMENGEINWTLLSQDHEVRTIGPGETHTFRFREPDVFQVIVLHHPADQAQDVLSVRIVGDYKDFVPLPTALLLSIPSLWMTGYVGHRIWRLKRAGLPINCSLPSHMWPDLSEVPFDQLPGVRPLDKALTKPSVEEPTTGVPGAALRRR